MKSIKTPNHPAYHWITLWPLEVWVPGLYNSWWFCVHKLSMFIYLSMNLTHGEVSRPNPCKLCTCENGVGVCNLQNDCPVLDLNPQCTFRRKENVVLFVKVGRRMLSRWYKGRTENVVLSVKVGRRMLSCL